MDESPPFLLSATLLREKVESWDAFPFNTPLIKAFDKLTFHPNVTFLIGENGAGKIHPS